MMMSSQQPRTAACQTACRISHSRTCAGNGRHRSPASAATLRDATAEPKTAIGLAEARTGETRIDISRSLINRRQAAHLRLASTSGKPGASYRTKYKHMKRTKRAGASESAEVITGTPENSDNVPKGHGAFITESQALNLLRARDFAQASGMPLNAAFVVSMVGCRFYHAGEATPASTSLCRKQALTVIRTVAAERGFPLAFTYTLENPPTGGYGLHANFLMHLPADQHAQLLELLQGRFEQVFAWAPRDGSFKPFYSTPHVLTDNDTVRISIYNLKGIDPQVATYARPDFTGAKNQGTIHGKRVGCSQNIDRGARRNAQHRDTATRDDLNAREYLNRLRQKKRADREPFLKEAFKRAATSAAGDQAGDTGAQIN